VNPLVSIVIPTYNYCRYLPRALQSCIDQSYENLEIIVIDDGSTDNTKALVKNLVNRVTYVYQENQGVSAARNRGLEMATGEFIAFLDADDYLTGDSIKERLGILLKERGMGFVISTGYSQRTVAEAPSYKAEFNEDVASDRLSEALLSRKIPFATCAVLMRTEIARRFRFPTGIANGEDIAYFTKVFFGTKGYLLSRPTVVTCTHPDSLRHNLEEIRQQNTALIETIFDDPYFGGAIEFLRKDFAANRYFEFFRRFYSNGDRKEARAYYKKAISMKPQMILKIDYLVKFLRTYL
jgi:glycosyltransferase involved in cell wall biosynthesis